MKYFLSEGREPLEHSSEKAVEAESLNIFKADVDRFLARKWVIDYWG